MPAFAPATSVMSQRLRGQDARDAHHHGLVTIAGRVYDCEIHLEGIEPQIDSSSGNVEIAQRGHAVIRKTLMTTPPKREAVITHKTVDYIIDGISGHDDSAPAWRLTFYRLPPK